MRFNTDENLPDQVAELLREAGWDSVTIHAQSMVGDSDAKVASVCRAEKRTLVTLDIDFSDIRTYPPSEYSGIVVLRPRDQAKPTVLSLITQLIPLLATEPLDGNLWILQETGLRIREGT
jgi:predicted nuclease of predicted toxin-antitoxin system